MPSSSTYFKKGHTGYRKKTGRYINCEVCNNSIYLKPNYKGKRRSCSIKCRSLLLPKRKTSQKTKEKLRITSIKAGCKPPIIKAEKHYLWKGGVSGRRFQQIKGIGYYAWRKAVFTRDNWICQECNQRGGKLQAHHIKPFALYPELSLSIDNGLTLCFQCHKKTDSYCGRIHKYKLKRHG